MQTSKPSVEGPEGAQAFVDLATYYQDHQKPPPVDRVLQELDSVDQAARASSGKYILALLAQSQADETNGRGGWQRSGLPAWGSDPESDARAFRESLAEKLAGGTTATEALDAAVWLLKEDNLADDQKHGVTLLCRIKSRRVEDLFQELLRQPHPNQSVLVAVLEQVAERKLVEPAPEVRRLAIHYREAVRAAAHKAAKALEISDVAEYQPEKAFTPWLDGLLKDIAAMIEGGVPEGAKWSDFTVTYPPSQTGGEPFAWSTSGWLLSEDNDKVQVLSWLGSRYELPKTRTKVEPSTLAKAGRTLLRIRKEATGAVSDANQEVLSPSGSLSAQFEPAFINLPEGLVAAWLHERGDKRLTAELLFPRIEAAEDDRWIGWATRDMLGNVYHREMLDTFANDRDYESTIRLAKHLSKTVFDGYPYQQRAKKLAAQLANRGDDFKAFRLPTPDEWQQLTMKLDRAQQIEYLAARLRLLNCFQWGQPGGVDYGDPQTAKPGRQLAKDQMRERWSNPYGKHPSQVVNPFVELREMNIQVADLSALVPFLADENFMPTYSYWRDFHPDRTLHQVNWAVAEIVNGVAKHDLAQLSEFLPLDEQGRQRHIDSILEWCRQHAGKSGNELLLQSLAEAKRWREFKWAADEAAEKRLTDALPIFVRRFTDFDHCQDDIAELCYLVDSADAVAPAHKWSTSEDESVRFWSALILLRHGDQTKPEGLAELEPILAKDDGSLRYPHAIEPLLATKNEKAVTLAYGILRKDGFRCSDVSSSPILERLFLAGRQEGLDYMLAHLESEEPSGSAIGVRDGKEVQRSLVEGDRAAIIATSWQTGDKTFDAFSPDDARRSQRKQLRGWLETQYALIQAGKKPEMTILPVRLRMAQAQFDAP
ncbi:MAG: hypothetical protein NTW96_07175 [Planctomycetia bacterium]|nr:hypothetical protein [Planctomycetia bacterium]